MSFAGGAMYGGLVAIKRTITTPLSTPIIGHGLWFTFQILGL